MKATRVDFESVLNVGDEGSYVHEGVGDKLCRLRVESLIRHGVMVRGGESAIMPGSIADCWVGRLAAGIFLKAFSVLCPDTTKSDRLRAVQILVDHDFGPGYLNG